MFQPSKPNGRSFKKRAQEYLLKWSFFGARVMHNLTLNNATSFGSFHLIRMLLDEYVLLAVESQLHSEKEQELQALLEKHTQADDMGAKPTLQQSASTCFVASQNRAPSRSGSVMKREQYGEVATTASFTPVAFNGRESYGMSPQLTQLGQTMTGGTMLTPPISPIVPNPINPRNSVISQGPIAAYGSSAQSSMLASTFPYLGQQSDYGAHNYLSNYTHPSSVFRSHPGSASYTGSYMMRNDLETYSYPDQSFASDPYSTYSPYAGQASAYPPASVGLTSAGNSGSAFNVVQSAASSFGSHPSYQNNDYYGSTGFAQAPKLVEHVPVIQQRNSAPSHHALQSGHAHNLHHPHPHSHLHSHQYPSSEMTDPLNLLDRSHRMNGVGLGVGLGVGGVSASCHSPMHPLHQNGQLGEDLMSMDVSGMMGTEPDMTSHYADPRSLPPINTVFMS
ncbi:hypothetical protein V1264_003512 [Littorina saxatilis]|uniref:RFX1-4/6/8-like BCD domain-containing protein n=1 Tax=Littorina saxatilis TaxID=31220 RepID=A0AAN9G9C3_9CAEN